MFGRKNKKTNDTPDQFTDEEVKDMAQAATVLAALLARSSMSDAEKQIWLNLIPLMANEQLLELQKILMAEQLGKIQYQELQKLQNDIMDINEKYDQKILAEQKKALTELDKIEAEVDQLSEK